MKKIISLFIVLILIVTTFSACSNDSGLYYDYDLSKYVTLGQYSTTVDRNSNEYKRQHIYFHKDVFGTDLAYEAKSGYVEYGDTANIDYKGTKDGVAFEGGTSSNYDLEIGSGTFIDGFEDGLIGAKIGDTVKLNLTFPKEYQSEELAGKAVVFEVKINYSTKLGNPTEADAVEYGYKSLADYEKEADNFAVGMTLFYKIVNSAKIKEYPAEEKAILLENAIAEYENYFASQNTTLDSFLEYQSMTYSDFEKQVLESDVYPSMKPYLVANYILQVKESYLTLEEVEAKRKELDDKYEETLESLGFNTIAIQHNAALTKVIKLLVTDAKVIN